MAVVGPPPKCVCTDAVAALGTWRHVDRVFTYLELPVVVLDIAPHPMQVYGMLHHRVVDKHNAYPLAIIEAQRLGVSERDAVERPGEFFHMAGQVQLDFAPRIATVGIFEQTGQVTIRQDPTAIVA